MENLDLNFVAEDLDFVLARRIYDDTPIRLSYHKVGQFLSGKSRLVSVKLKIIMWGWEEGWEILGRGFKLEFKGVTVPCRACSTTVSEIRSEGAGPRGWGGG